MRQHNFVICEPKLTNFSALDVELIIVVNTVFPPNFWTDIIKSNILFVMWQNFAAIDRRSSEIQWRKKNKERTVVKHKTFRIIVPGGLIIMGEQRTCVESQEVATIV